MSLRARAPWEGNLGARDPASWPPGPGLGPCVQGIIGIISHRDNGDNRDNKDNNMINNKSYDI